MIDLSYLVKKHLVRLLYQAIKDTLKAKLGQDKVGSMFCLGYCYENNAFHYNGENYAGKDIEKIDQILKGEKIKQDKLTNQDKSIKQDEIVHVCSVKNKKIPD